MFINSDHHLSLRSKLPYLSHLATLILLYLLGATSQADSLIWLPSRNCNFTIRSAWEATRKRSAKVPWRKVIRHRSLHPGFKFMMWLTVMNKLPTKERLTNIGISDSDLCLICGNHAETLNHLFFECSFS